MSDELDGLTDAQLNETLAGLLPPAEHRFVESKYGPDECVHCGAAPFDEDKGCRVWWTASADEVIKLLGRLSPDWSMRTYGGESEVRLHFVGPAQTTVAGWAAFPRAGVLAAVRALRAGAKLS